MNLESDKRLNIQLRLDFSSAPTGEARQAGWEDIESLSAICLEPRERAGLVRTHQPAIPGNIGGEYGGELALDLIRSHPGSLPAINPLRRLTAGRLG